MSRFTKNPLVLSLSKDRIFLGTARRSEGRPFDKLRVSGKGDVVQ